MWYIYADGSLDRPHARGLRRNQFRRDRMGCKQGGKQRKCLCVCICRHTVRDRCRRRLDHLVSGYPFYPRTAEDLGRNMRSSCKGCTCFYIWTSYHSNPSFFVNSSCVTGPREPSSYWWSLSLCSSIMAITLSVTPQVARIS